MSTTRISGTDSGMRLTFVRIRSASSSAVPRGQERHLDRPVGLELCVDQLLDPRAEALGQRVELEVHPGRQRLHVPAGDRGGPLVPDHPAQHVQRGVGAHQRVAPVPVDLAVDGVADGRERRALADHVPDIVTSLGDADHRRAGQRPRVVGLSAPGRVEGGAIQGHPPLVGIDRQDRAVEVPEEGIPQVQQLSRHGPIMARGRSGFAANPLNGPSSEETAHCEHEVSFALRARTGAVGARTIRPRSVGGPPIDQPHTKG